MRIFICCLIIFYSTCFAKQEFGYVTYSVTNLGDYVQSIAAKKFLPKNSIGIDREFVAVFEHPNDVNVIMNGWFMHTKDVAWYRDDILGPEKSWPPAPCIKPLLISMHFWEGFRPYLLTKESKRYMRKHGPVGARDKSTMEFLQENGIPAYFSSCLTLTLDNPYTDKDREEIIYAVDIDNESLEYLKRNASCEVIVLTHSCLFLPMLSEKQKLQYTEKTLDCYRKAKCVITQRFHVAMPCLAFETPVLFIEPKGSRFGGNGELLYTCTQEEFITGKSAFDFNNPPKNKPDYLPLRENLIKTVKSWVRLSVQKSAILASQSE